MLRARGGHEILHELLHVPVGHQAGTAGRVQAPGNIVPAIRGTVRQRANCTFHKRARVRVLRCGAGQQLLRCEVREGREEKLHIHEPAKASSGMDGIRAHP